MIDLKVLKRVADNVRAAYYGDNYVEAQYIDLAADEIAQLRKANKDMYEALIDLIEVMAGEQEAEDELEKAWGKSGRTAIEKARRVLSKAEGGNK